MRARRWLQACLVCVLLLATRDEARASLVQALELAELTEAAEQVVLGRVMNQSSHYDEAGRIVTDVQVQVVEVEKGPLAPGASLLLRSFGGVVNGLGMRIEGEPSFEDGQEVLLFVAQLAQQAVLRPVGMSQGAMLVYEEAGQRWVRSMAGGVSLVKKGSSGELTAQAAAVAQPRLLDDVMREVRTLVAQNKKRAR
jgi:hypothetical protein